MKNFTIWDIKKIINDLRIHTHPGPMHWFGDTVEFDMQSHNRWALDDLELWILKHATATNWIDVLDQYQHRMDTFACMAKSPEANFMFGCAYDVAGEILDQLIICDQAFGCDEYLKD